MKNNNCNYLVCFMAFIGLACLPIFSSFFFFFFSIFVFVFRHRWTGRFEAHLWDKGSWNPTQKKKGKQGKLVLFYLVARGVE